VAQLLLDTWTLFLKLEKIKKNLKKKFKKIKKN